jgi:hypothetical protein
MTKNIGTIDQAVRVIVALTVGVLILAGTLTGLTATILGAVAVVFVLTGVFSFCPLYAILKLSTRKIEGKK